MSYGQNIKAARKIAGLTQEQLAKKCDLATITIQQYELEKREPRIEYLERIAKALNISLSKLTNISIQYGRNGEINGMVGYAEDLKAIVCEDRTIEETDFAKDQENLCSLFNMLNSAGMQKAIERIQELTEIPKYKK